MSQHSGNNPRAALSTVRRCVIKIGSALLTGTHDGIDENAINDWVRQIVALRARGLECLLVTSGSVAVGMQRLGLSERPHALHTLQAMAAVGQMGLVQAYERAFQAHDLHTAQVLLTHGDLAHRGRYLNARTTLRTLLELGTIPVINENDTVAVEEIRFGDNDTLAAQVVNLVEADLLIILTDQAGLYDADPRKQPDAKLIHEAAAGDPQLEKMASSSGVAGRGGMRSKLEAATMAARSGAATVIAAGQEPQVLERILAGEKLGTYLRALQGRIAARKQWLAAHLKPNGQLQLDSGAVSALTGKGKSLLSVGVLRVEGEFARGELVSCVDAAGKEIARGLVNYNAADAGRIIGHSSEKIESILGYVDEPELIHRDNMVIL